tara:strand:- start:1030 stop:1299 length:270 start_codon:yes stop_codon:yes gene_type:complete
MPIDLDNIFDLDQVWWEKASKEEALPRAFSEIKRLQVEIGKARSDWQRLQNNLVAMQRDRNYLAAEVRDLKYQALLHDEKFYCKLRSEE